MYLVLPCVAAVITSTVLYAVDYNKVYQDDSCIGRYSDIDIGTIQVLRNDNLNVQNSENDIKEDIIKSFQQSDSLQTRQAMASISQSVNTSRYQIINMNNSENVFVEKIVTDDNTYENIESALDSQVQSEFKASDPIYFQDAILKRYVDNQNNIISLLGYINSQTDQNSIDIINIQESSDFGVGEIHQNIEGNLQVIYKDEYINNLIKLIIIMCCDDLDGQTSEQIYQNYEDINKYFQTVGYSSCKSLQNFINISNNSQIVVNSARFGKQIKDREQMDRIYVQLSIDEKIYNLLIKLDPDYKVFDTDLI